MYAASPRSRPSRRNPDETDGEAFRARIRAIRWPDVAIPCEDGERVGHLGDWYADCGETEPEKRPGPPAARKPRAAPASDYFTMTAPVSERERPADATIRRALTALRRGERQALDELFSLVYPELRHIAHSSLLRSEPGATLNTTALVHELYIKLARASVIEARDRGHFLAVSARAMRQILVDRARYLKASKRDGGQSPLRLDLADGPDLGRAAELLALDSALGRLEKLNPRLSQTVELRFFGGLSVDEAADVLGVSARTVKRDWRKARAYLFQALTEESSE
jgi:RNA polymerase sigma-70 factor, ECF subfamily